MRDTLTLTIEIPTTWDGGTRLAVYTDRGTGVIDEAAPLSHRPVDVFPGAAMAMGWGEHSWGEGQHGTNYPDLPIAGLETTTWGESPWGEAPHLITIDLPLGAAYGNWKFSVRAFDFQGNAQGTAPVELTAVVSSRRPNPVARLTFASYDAPTDVLTFNVVDGAE